MSCINKSLSCLGNCISALLDTDRKHVPFRDSKLTRILQDSLGTNFPILFDFKNRPIITYIVDGSSVTSMIVTLGPHQSSFHETLSSLQFADRAKRVVTTPIGRMNCDNVVPENKEPAEEERMDDNQEQPVVPVIPDLKVSHRTVAVEPQPDENMNEVLTRLSILQQNLALQMAEIEAMKELLPETKRTVLPFVKKVKNQKNIWKSHIDEETGCRYYHNVYDGSTQWENPNIGNSV